MIKTSHKLFY